MYPLTSLFGEKWTTKVSLNVHHLHDKIVLTFYQSIRYESEGE